MEQIIVPEKFKQDHLAFAKWYWELLKLNIGESAADSIEQMVKDKGADTAFKLSVFDGGGEGEAPAIFKSVLNYLEKKN